MDRGVDEATTSKYCIKLAQKQPMKAGALHTIIADGAWTPQRTHNRQKHSNGQCLLCESKDGGANHIWWDCLALNRHNELGSLHLHDRRAKETNKP
eukprot:14901721-Heterocapsa_arctica.AAC.1